MSYPPPPAMHHNDSLMIDNGFASVDNSNDQPMTQDQAELLAMLAEYDRQLQQAELGPPLEPSSEHIVDQPVIDRAMVNTMVPLTDAEVIEGEAILAANNQMMMLPPSGDDQMMLGPPFVDDQMIMPPPFADNQMMLPLPAENDQMMLASPPSNDQMTFPVHSAPMFLPGPLEPKNIVTDDKYSVKKPIGRRENSAAARKRQREKEEGPEPKPERPPNRMGMRSGYRDALNHHKRRCRNPVDGCKPDCKLWVDFHGDHERLSSQRIPRPRGDSEVDLYRDLDVIKKRVRLWDHLAADYLAAS